SAWASCSIRTASGPPIARARSPSWTHLAGGVWVAGISLVAPLPVQGALLYAGVYIRYRISHEASRSRTYLPGLANRRDRPRLQARGRVGAASPRRARRVPPLGGWVRLGQPS